MLWFSLKVNDRTVGMLTAKRRELTVPADHICSYDVRVTTGDDSVRYVVRHNVDAGAFALVAAILAQHPGNPYDQSRDIAGGSSAG